MAPAEAALLLRRAGLELEFEGVQTLVSRTGGWPTALYLAALSLAERAAEADSSPSFRGDDHLFAEYVRDEVLDRLPRASLTFLRRASILDELSGETCDAVLGVRRSALRIRQLAEISLLLEPVDAAHERYRWHPLLRELMNAELRRREPELVPSLHVAASAWHADHGDLDSGDRARGRRGGWIARRASCCGASSRPTSARTVSRTWSDGSLGSPRRRSPRLGR